MIYKAYVMLQPFLLSKAATAGVSHSSNFQMIARKIRIQQQPLAFMIPKHCGKQQQQRQQRQQQQRQQRQQQQNSFISSSSLSKSNHYRQTIKNTASKSCPFNEPVAKRQSPYKHTRRRGEGSCLLFSSTTPTSNHDDEGQNHKIKSNDNGNGNGNVVDEEDDEEDYNTKIENEKFEQQTKKWIHNVVIGLNLCPFATSSQIYTTVIRGNELQDMVVGVLYECIKRQDNSGTTIVICPDLYPDDFNEYLNVVNVLDQVLDDYDLKDDLQIAPFHPLFQFENTNDDAVENYTNRSPYPIFHILREEEVANAVEKLDGDSSTVFQRNIDLLQKLDNTFGRAKIEEVMKGEKLDGLQDFLKNKKSDD